MKRDEQACTAVPFHDGLAEHLTQIARIINTELRKVLADEDLSAVESGVIMCLLIRKQAIEISAKEQEDHRHHKRAEKSDSLTHGGVQLCKVTPFFAEASADQRHRRHRKPITERERQTHHIHANLVRSIRSGAEVRNGDGEQQKADAQENLLRRSRLRRKRLRAR